MKGTEKLSARYPLAKQMVEEGTASPRVKRAVELLLEDKVGREIAKEMGISVSTALGILSDPTGEKAKERKDRNHGICADCGAKTFHGGSKVAPTRCKSCAQRRQTEAAKAGIIDAIRDWHCRHGKPPGAMDWNVALAQKKAHPARLAAIEKAHRQRRWPAASGVQGVFGSWSAAIRAAGFESTEPGQRIDPDTWKAHMKGRHQMLSPAEVIDREIEKNEQRKATLSEQISQLAKNIEQLQAAKAVLVKD